METATTDLEVIDAWFGMDPRLNYGVRLGRELGNTGKMPVVVDVDRYKEGGDDALATQEAIHGRLPETAEVISGGGGSHYYYLADCTLSFVGTMGQNIDLKVNGYVVGPGSLHRSGRRYEWEASSDLFDGQKIEDIPKWVIDHFSKMARDSSPAAICTTSPLTPVEILSIKHTLSVIPANCCRDDWVKILMGLHSRNQGEQMFELADAWSQTCPKKYESAAVRAAWDSFRADGGITYDHVKGVAGIEIAKSVDLTKLMVSLNRMPVTVQEDDPIAATNAQAQIEPPPFRFTLRSSRELADAPPPKWTIRGLLPQIGVAALYGASGVGKSFLTLSMCAAIAGANTEWFGLRVTQRPVIYCALEGEAGMGKRMQAWEKVYKMQAPEALKFITQPFDLTEAADISALASAILASGGAGAVVVIDTLNRAAPNADENASKDMGKILSNAKKLQELVGGLILLVHHSGKQQSAGLRGHSSLKAAMDAVIHVHGVDKGLCWVAEKSKDDESGRAYLFRLEAVVVGEDDEGEEITSCAAVSTVPPDALRKAKKLGRHQQVAMDVLQRLFEALEHPHRTVAMQTAVLAIAEQIDVTSNHKTSRAKEALLALQNQRLIHMGANYVAPAGHVPDYEGHDDLDDEGDDNKIVCRDTW
jgi:hypothetical protein